MKKFALFGLSAAASKELKSALCSWTDGPKYMLIPESYEGSLSDVNQLNTKVVKLSHIDQITNFKGNIGTFFVALQSREDFNAVKKSRADLDLRFIQL